MLKGVKKVSKEYHSRIGSEIEKRRGSEFTYEDITKATGLGVNTVCCCLSQFLRKGFLNRVGRITRKPRNLRLSIFRQRKPLLKIAPAGNVAEEVWQIFQGVLEKEGSHSYISAKEIWERTNGCNRKSVRGVVSRLYLLGYLERWKSKYCLKAQYRGMSRPLVVSKPKYITVPLVQPQYAAAVSQ
ncbi:MAG: hypothetical protein PHN74_00235 [Candidatus Pacebacteria bacterium]|nr:hypothetical protein [Candidatus Paceibacterota bacterium]